MINILSIKKKNNTLGMENNGGSLDIVTLEFFAISSCITKTGKTPPTCNIVFHIEATKTSKPQDSNRCGSICTIHSKCIYSSATLACVANQDLMTDFCTPSI